MHYIVIELQKNGNNVGNIVTAFDNRNEAESKYFTVMAAAAISNVEKHACSLLTEDGVCIRNESYEHEVIANEG